jgi:hypothetical protein
MREAASATPDTAAVPSERARIEVWEKRFPRSGHETADAVELESGGHGRQELIGDDDGAVGHLRTSPAALFGEEREQAPAHVEDVRRPLAKVAVPDGLQGAHVFVEDAGHHPLDVEALFLDGAEDALAQRLLLQEQALHVEDLRLARADPVADVLLQGSQLDFCLADRCIEPRALGGDLRRRDRPLRNRRAPRATDDVRPSQRHAGGDLCP